MTSCTEVLNLLKGSGYGNSAPSLVSQCRKAATAPRPGVDARKSTPKRLYSDFLGYVKSGLSPSHKRQTGDLSSAWTTSRAPRRRSLTAICYRRNSAANKDASVGSSEGPNVDGQWESVPAGGPVAATPIPADDTRKAANGNRWTFKQWAMVVLAFGALASVAWLQNLSAAGLVDDTEPLFAEAARQMVVTGDWVTPQFNAQPRFDKPVMVYWLMAIMVKLFGPAVWAIRLPSALCALSLALAIAATVYRFGAPLASAHVGATSASPGRGGVDSGDGSGGGSSYSTDGSKYNGLESGDRIDRLTVEQGAQGSASVPSAGLFAAPRSPGRVLLAFVSTMAFCLSLEAMIWGSTALSDMPLAAAIGHCLLAFFWGYAGTREARNTGATAPPAGSSDGGDVARGRRGEGSVWEGGSQNAAGYAGAVVLSGAADPSPLILNGSTPTLDKGEAGGGSSPDSLSASPPPPRGHPRGASTRGRTQGNRSKGRGSYSADASNESYYPDAGGEGGDNGAPYVDAAARRARAESVQQRLRRRWRSGGTGEAWQMRWWEGQRRRGGTSTGSSSAGSGEDAAIAAESSDANDSSNVTAPAWTSPYRAGGPAGRLGSAAGGRRSAGGAGTARGGTGTGAGAEGAGGTQSYRRRVHQPKGLVGALEQRWAWLSSARVALAAHLDDLRDNAEVQRRVLLQQLGFQLDAGADVAGGIPSSLPMPDGADLLPGIGPVPVGRGSRDDRGRQGDQEYPWAYPVAAASAGIAVLVKGPVGLVLPAGVIGSFLLYTGDLWPVLIREAPLLRCIGICLATCVPWYLLMAYLHGVRYFATFFGYHNLERFASGVNHHGARPLWYPLAVVTSGYFPWSLTLPAALASVNPLSPASLARWRATPRPRRLLLFATFWFGFVFCLFSLSSSQLPSYYLPLAPAVAILAASHLAPEEERTRTSGQAQGAAQGKPPGVMLASGSGGDERAPGMPTKTAGTVGAGRSGGWEQEQGVNNQGRTGGIAGVGQQGRGWIDDDKANGMDRDRDSDEKGPSQPGDRSAEHAAEVSSSSSSGQREWEEEPWALTGGRGAAAALTCLVTALVYGAGAKGATLLPDILGRSGDHIAELLSRVLVERGLALLAAALLAAGALGASLAMIRALQKDPPSGPGVVGRRRVVNTALAAAVGVSGGSSTDPSMVIGTPGGASDLPSDGSQSEDAPLPVEGSGKEGAVVDVSSTGGGGRSRLPWLWSVNGFVMASLLMLFVRPVYVAVDKLRQEPLRVLAATARAQQESRRLLRVPLGGRVHRQPAPARRPLLPVDRRVRPVGGPTAPPRAAA
eukprot:jgi/Mesvir1/18960/Mv18929-RA.3